MWDTDYAIQIHISTATNYVRSIYIVGLVPKFYFGRVDIRFLDFRFNYLIKPCIPTASNLQLKMPLYLRTNVYVFLCGVATMAMILSRTSTMQDDGCAFPYILADFDVPKGTAQRIFVVSIFLLYHIN